MNYILNYKLFEFKNIGDVYHIVDLEKLDYILKNNKIKSFNFSNISTTRNKYMMGYLGDKATSFIKLELDGNKLSNRYKIKPYAYKTHNAGYLEEYEEQIKTQEIKDADKYIKKIIIIKDRLESLKKSGWFDTEGGHFKGERRNIPDILKELLTDNFDIWIQDGYKIYKDDDYLKSILNHEIKQIYKGYIPVKKERIRRKDFGFNNKHKMLDEYNKGFIEDRCITKENEELVIGWHYRDLYLLKELPDNFKQAIVFQYEKENVIEETEEYIKVKKAKVCDVFLFNF